MILYPTDSGLTHLLHDLSPDGGTYPNQWYYSDIILQTSRSDPWN